uniref:Uncharacterized protein n=1 Tax=Cannabis sativa TaxID=3483 RepID=A0A803Q759_CANSA
MPRLPHPLAGPDLKKSELVANLRAQCTILSAAKDVLINSKAKCKPQGRLVPTKPPHIITQKDFSDIFGRASDAEAKVTELETAIGKLKTVVSNLQGIVNNAKDREKSQKNEISTVKKKTIEVEGSLRKSIDEKISSVAELKGQVHHLEGQVEALEAKVVADVSLYEGYCFDAIFNSWLANGGAVSFKWVAFDKNRVCFLAGECERHANEAALYDIDLNLNGDVPNVGDAAGVASYNPEHPDMPALEDAPKMTATHIKELL